MNTRGQEVANSIEVDIETPVRDRAVWTHCLRAEIAAAVDSAIDDDQKTIESLRREIEEMKIEIKVLRSLIVPATPPPFTWEPQRGNGFDIT